MWTHLSRTALHNSNPSGSSGVWTLCSQGESSTIVIPWLSNPSGFLNFCYKAGNLSLSFANSVHLCLKYQVRSTRADLPAFKIHFSRSFTYKKQLDLETREIHWLIGKHSPLSTRCNRGFYCRSYCLLNMFRAPLCPSSGAPEYYTVPSGKWHCIVGWVGQAFWSM